jgi:signal transduction histidine kinase
VISAKLLTGLETRVGDRSCDLKTFGLRISLRRSRHSSTASRQNAAPGAAEAADKAKFIDMIGHELRTLMQGVIDMSALLLASPLDGTQLRYTETLAQSARSLLGVLNDVLDLSKLEAGRFELDQASFDLHELVNSVAAVVQTRANEKGLTSGVDIGASCPRFVIGDAARIHRS